MKPLDLSKVARFGLFLNVEMLVELRQFEANTTSAAELSPCVTNSQACAIAALSSFTESKRTIWSKSMKSFIRRSNNHHLRPASCLSEMTEPVFHGGQVA